MSTQQERRFEAMVFDYCTSYRSDYHDGEIRTVIKTEYKEKSTHRRTHGSPLKYLQTMSDFQRPIPISLMMKPNEILHRDPGDVQKTFLAPLDTERGEVQKSRPRVVMTPAIKVDDIKEPGRQILVNDTYTTTTMRQLQDSAAAFPKDSFTAPLGMRPAPALPLKLPKLQMPYYVSLEWRMDSVTWDTNQLRAYCEPTKKFWLDREKIKDVSCVETPQRSTHTV